MEFNEINVEHTGVGGNQHYQQHFQQHYAATESASNRTPMGTPHMTSRFPHVPIQHQPLLPLGSGGTYETHRQESSSHHQSPLSSHESRSQVIHSQGIDPISGNPVTQVEKHEKQSSKKTVQTTTTTTSTTPVILTGAHDQQQALLPVTNVVCDNTGIVRANGSRYDDDMDKSYTIQVEHHNAPNSFNWSNADIYLHIFLTFFFGCFATTLFFDGILRSIVYLYVLHHSAMSPLIYILNIIFSIVMLAFTIWFLTICWRWWRNKSLQPLNYDQYQRTVGPRERQSNAHGYVFLAGCILIISFFIFIILGIVDISFKHEQEIYNRQFKPYTKAMFLGDYIIFGFRCVLWVVGIIATFLLSRDVLMKYCCPSKRIKIDKEKPTTVYEVRT